MRGGNIISSDYLYNIGYRIIDSKRKLVIADRNRVRGYIKALPNTNIKVYKCTCLKCNDQNVEISESHLKEGRGCPTCRGLKVVAGINDIPTTSPWMIKYFQGGRTEASNYTNNSNKTIYPKCPFCGRISEKPVKINKIYTKNGFSCHCSDGISYPEKFVSEFLNQLEIKYISQATKNNISWLKNNKRYDFYIPDKNIIIEANGKQHYEYNNWTGKTLKQEQLNDAEKENMAIKNGVFLYIKLDCRESSKEYIKNSILNSKLNLVYCLDNINWEQCEIRALSNITKEICDFYSNVSHDIKVISKNFDKSANTITRHLKSGNKYGWCKPLYDPCRKKVRVTKDNVVNIYESAKYVSQNCFDILKVEKATPSYIRHLCKCEKSINGYFLSYV